MGQGRRIGFGQKVEQEEWVSSEAMVATSTTIRAVATAAHLLVARAFAAWVSAPQASLARPVGASILAPLTEILVVWRWDLGVVGAHGSSTPRGKLHHALFFGQDHRFVILRRSRTQHPGTTRPPSDARSNSEQCRRGMRARATAGGGGQRRAVPERGTAHRRRSTPPRPQIVQISLPLSSIQRRPTA